MPQLLNLVNRAVIVANSNPVTAMGLGPAHVLCGKGDTATWGVNLDFWWVR